jgi:hypothetical protein
LFSAVLVELGIGKIYEHITGDNTIVYNVYIVLLVLYYTYIYTKATSTLRNKRVIVWISALYLTASIVNFSFIQGPFKLNTITYNIGMIGVVVLIFIFLYELLYHRPALNLFRFGMFWISIGIILYYSASFPILTFLNELIDVDLLLAHETFKLVKVGNVFLSLGYLMVVVCPLMPIK